MTSVLHTLRERYGQALDVEIQTRIDLLGGADFAGMMRYQLGYVDQHLLPTSGHTGKRSRPLICLAVCDAVGGTWTDGLAVAAGIELLHNFSLVHDDIEDHDIVRHHRHTVWRVWGEPQAINAGDGMFALATRAIVGTGLDQQTTLRLVREFLETTLALTRGQHLDMSFESRQDVTADQYLEMIGLKTAALIAYSTWAGAAVGKADETTQAALRAFGEALGRAFQIHDDIQGIWGIEEHTGKEVATDLRNRKKTLPVLLALDGTTGQERAGLQAYYGGESDDLSAVRSVLTGGPWRARAEEEVNRFRRQALDALAEASLRDEHRRQLAALVDELTFSPSEAAGSSRIGSGGA